MVCPLSASGSAMLRNLRFCDLRQVNESGGSMSLREGFLAPSRPKVAYSARSFCISGIFRPLGFHPVTVRHDESLAHFPWRHTCCFLLGCGTRSKHSGSASTAGVG